MVARTPRITRRPPAAQPSRHPRRHRQGGGYARGERTRRRIIESAIDMFAAGGYQATSTRAIARRARVSLPALQYYFGGKPGLHRACIEYITADLRARLEPAFERARAALEAPGLTHAQLLALLRTVVDPFLEGMASARPESWVLFFERAQHERNPAFQIILQHISDRLFAFCSEIIARILGRPAGEPQVMIRALSIVGQVAMVRRGRSILLHALHWPDFDGERLELLKSVLWQSIESGLTGTARAPRR